MVARAVYEYHLVDMDEASTAVADDRLSIERSHCRATRTSKVPSDSQMHQGPLRSHRLAAAHSVASTTKNAYQNNVIRYLTPLVTGLPSMGAAEVVTQSIAAATEAAIRRNSQ